MWETACARRARTNSSAAHHGPPPPLTLRRVVPLLVVVVLLLPYLALSAAARSTTPTASESRAEAHSATAAGTVTVTLNGKPAVVGNYTKTASTSITMDNGLLRFTLVADGADVNMADFTVAGVAANLAHTTEKTWYEDWSGGSNGNDAGVDTIRILRLTPSLAEVALADTRHPRRRLEQHILMTADTAGLYTFTAMTVVSAGEGLNEIRHNTRWDRCVLNHAFNHERPPGIQPTYPYLDNMPKLQDETWRVDGKPNASLACPADNNGDLPAGRVYTKYMWSLYHAENPFFGHFGAVGDQLVGVWLTPLSGISNATSAASYGVGPQHQDLAIHQDGIILNYMDPNHYGLPAYSVPRGYNRLYGPYLLHATVGAAANPSAFFASAAASSARQIAASIPALSIISHPWYAPASARANVTGRIVIADGRPGSHLWALMSTQFNEQIYDIHEPLYYVLTRADGSFTIPGVPPGNYTLYAYAASGSITDTLRRPNVVVSGSAPAVDVGVVTWTPDDNGMKLLWQVGVADRSGGEFALSRRPRAWELPGLVPGDLNFTIGSSYEARHWYYAQTQGGTWSVIFKVPDAVAGSTARLTVSASLTDGYAPTVTVNGNRVSGALPGNEDSTLSRQAVRSGYPRLAVLTFPTTWLRVGGDNVLTFSRPAAPGGNNNTGMGWDTVKLQVPGSQTNGRPALTVTAVRVLSAHQLRITVVNDGPATAMCTRLEELSLVGVGDSTHQSSPLQFSPDFDPALFPLPLGVVPGGGGSSSVDVLVDNDLSVLNGATFSVRISADGGHTIVNSILSARPAAAATAVIATDAALATVDPAFLGVNIDTASFTNHIDLTDPYLRILARQLSAADGSGSGERMHLRVGGSAANGALYSPHGQPGRGPGGSTTFTDASLTILNDFAMQSDMQITFCLPYQTHEGRWDPNINASSLWAQALASKWTGFSGWSLGNEIIGGGGFNVAQYAMDYVSFRNNVTALAPSYAQNIVGPSAAGWPGPAVLAPFLRAVAGLPRMSISLHAYSFGNCTLHTYLGKAGIERMAYYYALFAAARDANAPQLPLYLEEMATQAGGGCDGLSNRFVSGFWFLHALGLAGRYGIHRVTRQDLVGWSFTSGVSHYPLAGVPGWRNRTLDGIPTPHPDYYTAVLWRQLVGSRVLSVDMTTTAAVNETFAVHAWCATKQASAAGAVVLVYINMAEEAVELSVSGVQATPRVEFILTAPGGNLTADAVLLNGERWGVDAQGNLPVQPVPGKRIAAGGAGISLPGGSYGFLTFDQGVKVCGQGSEAEKE